MEMMEVDEPLPSSEAPRASALDLGNELATPTAGPDASIGSTARIRGLTTSGEQRALQDDLEQVLCRRLVCVCDALQGCCEHTSNAFLVHPRVHMLILNLHLDRQGQSAKECPGQIRGCASLRAWVGRDLFFQQMMTMI
jgi:hypothetical protein